MLGVGVGGQRQLRIFKNSLLKTVPKTLIFCFKHTFLKLLNNNPHDNSPSQAEPLGFCINLICYDQL
jgi:hypothetical protein